jgi:hypothetical protein
MIAVRSLEDAAGAVRLFPSVGAIHVPSALSPERAGALSEAVLAARGAWTRDFGGEQFSLGRAFYTHLETARARAYFEEAARSNAQVEATLPGFAEEMRALLARLVGGTVRQRHGWCAAGVHVFPAGEKVARAGGVVHFDVEGLTRDHLHARRRAVSLVVMLQPPSAGGGLRVHDARYAGREHATEDEVKSRWERLDYGPGDAVLLDSYRLHQIEGFTGARARISGTLHGAETSNGVWECWF